MAVGAASHLPPARGPGSILSVPSARQPRPLLSSGPAVPLWRDMEEPGFSVRVGVAQTPELGGLQPGASRKGLGCLPGTHSRPPLSPPQPAVV